MEKTGRKYLQVTFLVKDLYSEYKELWKFNHVQTKNSMEKWARKFEKTLQQRCVKGKEAHEKTLKIISH